MNGAARGHSQWGLRDFSSTMAGTGASLAPLYPFPDQALPQSPCPYRPLRLLFLAAPHRVRAGLDFRIARP